MEDKIQKASADILELKINYRNLEGQIIKLTETVERSISSTSDRVSKLESFMSKFFYIGVGLGLSLLGTTGDKLLPFLQKL